MRGAVSVTAPAVTEADWGDVSSAAVCHPPGGEPRTRNVTASRARSQCLLWGARREAEAARAFREKAFDEVLRDGFVEGDLMLAVRRIGAILGHQSRIAVDFHTATRIFHDVDLLPAQTGLLRPVLAVRGRHPVAPAGGNAFDVLGDRQAGGGVLRCKPVLADFVGGPRVASVQDRVV